MNDAEYEAQVERVKVIRERWHKLILPHDWTIRYDFLREPNVVDCGTHLDVAIGMCEASWEYMRATITFSMPEVAQVDDDELEETLIHECCHVLVAEMNAEREPSSSAHNHEERVVTQMALAFSRVRDAFRTEGFDEAFDADLED